MTLLALAKRPLALVVLLAILAPAAFAIFGAGDIVYDPVIWLLLWEQYMTLASELERYQAIWTPWIRWKEVSDLFGLNAPWVRSRHGSQEYDEAYKTTTEPLEPSFTPHPTAPAADVERLKRQYASIERRDAANRTGAQASGAIWEHSKKTEQPITAFEQTVLSSSHNRTLIAEVMRLNAGQLFVIHGQQDTNQLLVQLVDQLVLESQAHRDVEARFVNERIQYLEKAPVVHEQLTNGISQTLSAFRMP
jgi:hypothetical protein